ncbi:MAG TPA: hypothetical protein VJI46_04705 [Candidatus Nanoarchaeia archaeon]|nr:hypothetical protein [Candidatus Nanoarchaeia archaeon]
MNSKGIELSVNFLITLILSLVLFGMGVMLVYNIFAGAEDLSKITEDELHKEIAALQCRTDARVCFGVETLEIERGDAGFFMVRVINVLDLPEPAKFSIELERGSLIRGETTAEFGMECDGSELCVKYEEQEESINNNEDYRFGIGVEPSNDAPSGLYSLKASVKCDVSDIQDVPEDIISLCSEGNYGFGILWVRVP